MRGGRWGAIAGLLLLVGVACGDEGGTPEVARSPGDESATPGATPSTDSAVSTSLDGQPSGPLITWLDGVNQNWDAVFPGARVSIEQNCVLLRPTDDVLEATLTVWPDGTTWDADTSTIVLPEGDVVRDGDVIDVGGGVISFRQDHGLVSESRVGADGRAKLEACVERHPDLQVWLFDAGTPPTMTPPATRPPPTMDQTVTATPDRVHPGDSVIITPGSAVERNCVEIVGVFDFDDVIIGQVIGRRQWVPARSGVPPTWPPCLGAISDAGMEMIVPPLATGGYRFCLSGAVDFVGCATVFVSEP